LIVYFSCAGKRGGKPMYAVLMGFLAGALVALVWLWLYLDEPIG
jgi:hypothetical protein